MALGIQRLRMGRFSTVAMKAGQSEIIEMIGAPLSEGDNMIHGKRHILPLLCRMTILTQAVRSMTYLRLHPARYGASSQHDRGVLSLRDLG